ncbi:MAG TPA: GGDEF domain-containing protein, partial [Clostridiales bacterium]|nr:GGDEF domain-containing protein [Clostridiales bacterium]
MMLNIHIGTLIVVIVTGHAFAGLLGGFYLAKRKKDATLYTFLLARFLDAFAWTLLGLRGCIPSWMSILVGNALLMAGSALQIVSFLSAKGRLTPQLKRRCYTIALLFLLLLQLALSLYSAQDAMRTALVSFSMAMLWSMPVYFSFRDKSASPLQKLITFVYGVGIIFLIFRGVGAMLSEQPMALLSNHLFNILFFFWLYLTTLVGNTGLILLSKEKADLVLTKAATCDELTDLYDRRAFFLHAKECLAFCARQQTPVSFFIMDLDHFKKINDFYGHIVGDMVIKNFAVTIKRQLRGYD